MILAWVSGNPARPDSAEAMPQPKKPAIEREGLPAEPLRRRRRREIQRTEQVAGHVRPAELSLADDILQMAGSDHCPGCPERLPKTICNTSDPRDAEMRYSRGPGHERPQPPFVAVRPVPRLIGVDDGLVWQGRFELHRARRPRAGFLPRRAGLCPD